MKFFFLLLLICLSLPVQANAKKPVVQNIRPASAAGISYPENAKDLKQIVKDLLDQAERTKRYKYQASPKAVVVPHDSLYFSGQTAASGYASLAARRAFVRRVVIIGAIHRPDYFGMALPRSKYWEIPGRRIEVDVQAAQSLAKIPGVSFDEDPFSADNSIELQLPFIASVFRKDVKILPVLVGEAGIEQVADMFAAVWGQMDTVVIVVTGMGQDSDKAKVLETDRATRFMIENKEYNSLKRSDLCGYRPVLGLLYFAAEHESEIKMLEMRNTADVFPEASEIKGYGAFGVYETVSSSENRKKELEDVLRANREDLLQLAQQSISSGFKTGRPLKVKKEKYDAALRRPGAVFINIYYNGALRGSAGSVEPSRSLIEDIAENAYHAAFQDYRFAPLTEQEMKEAEISVSFLTPKIPLDFENEADLLGKIRPGLDGLILRERANKALFLPSVWETFPSVREFWLHLKRKSGLSSEYWSPTLKVYRFEVIAL